MTAADPPAGQGAPVKRTRNRVRHLTDQDLEIWRLYCAGHTQEALGRRFGLDQANISRTIKKVRDSIPDEGKQEIVKREVAFLDAIRAQLMADFEAPLPPAFNQAGRPLVDPETGEIVRDKASRYAALDRALKSVERYARLLGLDQPAKVEAEVTTVTYVLLGVDEEALG